MFCFYYLWCPYSFSQWFISSPYFYFIVTMTYSRQLSHTTECLLWKAFYFNFPGFFSLLFPILMKIMPMLSLSRIFTVYTQNTPFHSHYDPQFIRTSLLTGIWPYHLPRLLVLIFIFPAIVTINAFTPSKSRKSESWKSTYQTSLDS